VLTHNVNLSPTVPCAMFEPDAIRRFFHWGDDLRPGVSRVMQSRASFHQMLAAEFQNLELDTTARRLSQFFDFNLLDQVPKFDGFFSVNLREFADLFDQLYWQTNTATRLLDFTGISRVSNSTNLVDWVSRDAFLPMVTGGQKPLFRGEPETLQAVLGDGFEPLHTVYLPPAAQAELSPTQSPVRVSSLRFAAHRLTFETESDAPGMVVIAQSYYHLWRPYVDGKPTKLWKANYAFQALEVPAGNHSVSLRYEDGMCQWGTVLSLVSLAACAAMWVGLRKRSAT
jgi:hypothetical protein